MGHVKWSKELHDQWNISAAMSRKVFNLNELLVMLRG